MPVNINEEQEHIKDFLKSKRVGVLATADKTGEPHAAAIYFYFEGPDFYFITKNQTAKHNNLQENPRAALAVFEPVSQTTVQAKGVVIEETDQAKANEVFGEILKAAASTSESGSPPLTKLKAGEYIVYKLKPASLRMASYIRPDPGSYENIFEIY